MIHYWQTLQPRERRILALGGLVLLAAMLFLLVIEPALEQRSQTRERLADARAELAWMQTHAPEVAARQEREPRTGPRSRDSGDGRSLIAHVDASARAAGLGEQLDRVRPTEDGVAIVFEAVPFGDLMRWLGELETDAGIVPTRIALERGARPGRANADLHLTREPRP
jgi:general secretion pathway protein M